LDHGPAIAARLLCCHELGLCGTCKVCVRGGGLQELQRVLQGGLVRRTGEALAHLARHAIPRALPRLRALQQLLLRCAVDLRVQRSQL
jgi:hypothetical protein